MAAELVTVKEPVIVHDPVDGYVIDKEKAKKKK
jgi:hypothetical protein